MNADLYLLFLATNVFSCGSADDYGYDFTHFLLFLSHHGPQGTDV